MKRDPLNGPSSVDNHLARTKKTYEKLAEKLDFEGKISG